MRYRDLSDEDLTLDPVIILGCNHVITMSSLDGYFELHNAYERSKGR